MMSCLCPQVQPAAGRGRRVRQPYAECSAYFEEKNRYFQEVDDFELEEETPSPSAHLPAPRVDMHHDLDQHALEDAAADELDDERERHDLLQQSLIQQPALLHGRVSEKADVRVSALGLSPVNEEHSTVSSASPKTPWEASTCTAQDSEDEQEASPSQCPCTAEQDVAVPQFTTPAALTATRPSPLESFRLRHALTGGGPTRFSRPTPDPSHAPSSSGDPFTPVCQTSFMPPPSSHHCSTLSARRVSILGLSSRARRQSVMRVSTLTPPHINMAVVDDPPVIALLKECHQAAVVLLSEFIDELTGDSEICKIGEGTYGEAFKHAESIIKIVPMAGVQLVNGEPQKALTEMRDEVLLTNTLTKLRLTLIEHARGVDNGTDGFVHTQRIAVCEGAYPQKLVQAWEDWDSKNGSENDPVSSFDASQLYMVFVFDNGGRDLEKFELQDFRQVKSLITQVAAALAVGELACGFEHRDLHWGNIVVRPCQRHMLPLRLDGRQRGMRSHGVQATLIDFTLSRLQTEQGKALYCDLSSDPSLFKGTAGDPQAETYRRMKKLTHNRWEEFYPKTNCMWIFYLLEVLLTGKEFRATSDDMHELKQFKKRSLNYQSAKNMLNDEFFQDTLL
eukprot:jgi/Chlat1/5623/Chrsp369S05390